MYMLSPWYALKVDVFESKFLTTLSEPLEIAAAEAGLEAATGIRAATRASAHALAVLRKFFVTFDIDLPQRFFNRREMPERGNCNLITTSH
jgi:hypothetical protein